MDYDNMIAVITAMKEGKELECIFPGQEQEQWNGWDNDTPIDFSSYVYRIKPVQKYIPYTFDDRDEFRDLWVIDRLGSECRIIEIGFGFVILRDESLTYKELLSAYKKTDGTPFGKKV